MSRGSYLPELTRMALDQGWARAHELDYLNGQKRTYAGVFGRLLKAGMTVDRARKTLELCNGKRQPHVFATACLRRWRAEQ